MRLVTQMHCRHAAAIVILHLFVAISDAQNLLVMDVVSNLSNGVAAATTITGATVVDPGTSIGFVDQLQNFGPWDVVIIDCPSSGMDTIVAQAIATYIANDGHAIIGYWNLDDNDRPGAMLRAAFGIATAVEYFNPLPVFTWDPSHPIWTTPITVGSPLTTIRKSWIDDGDRLVGTPGTTALGGFVDLIGARGEAAIVLANDSRTICNGFLFDNFDAETIVPLLVNQIFFLLGGRPPAELFRRGDTNDDSSLDCADAAALLNSLFVTGTPPTTCARTGDTNDDGVVNVADAVFFLNSLFVPGSPSIPPPGPGCGIDPTPDALDCLLYTTCP